MNLEELMRLGGSDRTLTNKEASEMASALGLNEFAELAKHVNLTRSRAILEGNEEYESQRGFAVEMMMIAAVLDKTIALAMNGNILDKILDIIVGTTWERAYIQGKKHAEFTAKILVGKEE